MEKSSLDMFLDEYEAHSQDAEQEVSADAGATADSDEDDAGADAGADADAGDDGLTDADQGRDPGDDAGDDDAEADDSDSEDATGDSPEDDAQVSPQVKAMQEQLEKLEKRFKDTQANWTREHMKVLELEKALAVKKPSADAGDDEWCDDDDVDVDTAAKSQLELEALKQEISQIRHQLVAKEIAIAEDAMRKQHADYDEIIEGFIVPEFESNPSVKEQWQRDGATPEAAYKLGLRLKQTKEIMADPEAYKQKLEQEILGRLNGDASRRPKPLLHANSQGSSKNTGQHNRSALDEALDL